MDDKNYSLREVADLIGEPLYSVRNWRRLPADNARHLPTTPDPDHGHHCISRENLARWLRRNPDLAERILSLYAPQAIRETLLPLARASHTAQTLRGDPLPEPTNHWWLPTEVDYDHQDQHQGGSA